MSDSDPWGYDAPGGGGPMTQQPVAPSGSAADTLDAKLDNSFAAFRAVGGVRQDVINTFVRMIDSDPESIVSALRQVINHGGPRLGGDS